MNLREIDEVLQKLQHIYLYMVSEEDPVHEEDPDSMFLN